MSCGRHFLSRAHSLAKPACDTHAPSAYNLSEAVDYWGGSRLREREKRAVEEGRGYVPTIARRRMENKMGEVATPLLL
jgi:hypothetical protein